MKKRLTRRPPKLKKFLPLFIATIVIFLGTSLYFAFKSGSGPLSFLAEKVGINAVENCSIYEEDMCLNRPNCKWNGQRCMSQGSSTSTGATTATSGSSGGTSDKKRECTQQEKAHCTVLHTTCKMVNGTATCAESPIVVASGVSCPGAYTSIGSGSWAQWGGTTNPVTGTGDTGSQVCVQCKNGTWDTANYQSCDTVDEIPRPDEIIEGTSDSQAGCYSGGTLYAAGSTLGGQSCSDGHWCGANQEWDNGTSKCIAKTAAPAATASTCTPGCEGNNVRNCPSGGEPSYTSCPHNFGSNATYCVVGSGGGSCVENGAGETVTTAIDCAPGLYAIPNQSGTGFTCSTTPATAPVAPPAGDAPSELACDPAVSTCLPATDPAAVPPAVPPAPVVTIGDGNPDTLPPTLIEGTVQDCPFGGVEQEGANEGMVVCNPAPPVVFLAPNLNPQIPPTFTTPLEDAISGITDAINNLFEIIISTISGSQ